MASTLTAPASAGRRLGTLAVRCVYSAAGRVVRDWSGNLRSNERKVEKTSGDPATDNERRYGMTRKGRRFNPGLRFVPAVMRVRSGDLEGERQWHGHFILADLGRVRPEHVTRHFY